MNEHGEGGVEGGGLGDLEKFILRVADQEETSH